MNRDEEKLPDVSEATLSDEDVASLVRDLRSLTTIEQIVIKAGPGGAGGAGGADDSAQPTLDEAAQLLLERAVRGVQIRYRYDDADWTDTLMPVADGVRLVRIRHDM